jgi:DNA repair exonuclease SbcCD ATPase subunit
MIESLMLIALGFLTATLFALIAIQFVWRRAVTVTTRKLTGDFDLDQAQQNESRLATLEVALLDKQHELAAALQQRARLEDALAAAGGEAQALRGDIEDLHVQQDALQREAETHLQNLLAVQSRVDELETAARAEIDKRGLLEVQLKTLGEKAARLVQEMSDAAAQIADTSGLGAAISAPVATPSPRRASEAQAPVMLAPFPTEDAATGDDLRALAEIKASLSNFSANVQAEFTPDEDTGEKEETPLPNERFLADRIRALEAGVAS